MTVAGILLLIAGLVVGVVLVLADPVLLSRIGEEDAGRPGGGVRGEAAGAGGERLSWR
ncbi:hypothetical protein ACLQ2R_38135 [Streptosporangium sp. DT93]|uniref:hypothetical protein n=1 Tax=Streptosporangium sp. DT93 TaxID=3393428 RepID=UPI003CE9E64B